MIIGARPASRKRGASRQALAINDVENQVPSYAVSEGPAPAAANKDLLTDDVSPTKEECLEAISAIATEYKCPITHQLPIDPVKGEDGRTYERSALVKWFATKEGVPTSPSTGAPMGKRLLYDVQARNTIEALIKSGAIDGDLAEDWRKRLADEKAVKELRAKAESGDGEAMYGLAVLYEGGEKGLAPDEAQARAWYKRSAAARNPKGKAAFGECLLLGIGGPPDNALGLVNLTEAAVLGSALAAYVLGGAFIEGKHGLSRDPTQARYWLEQAVKGKVDDLDHEIEVPELLRALDKTAAEEETKVEEETVVAENGVVWTRNGGMWSTPLGRPGV